MKDKIVLKELVGVYKETFPKHRYEEDIKSSFNRDETIAIKPGERHLFITDGFISDIGKAKFLLDYGGVIEQFKEEDTIYTVIINTNNKGYIRVKKGMEIGGI